jgi:competence protein ComEA
MNWKIEQVKSTVIAVALGIGGLLVWWWMQQPSPSAIDVQVESTPTNLETVSVNVVVDVQGKVRSPGIVQLPSGSRVIDAIEAAGGLLPRATPGVNLARVLLDGEQIMIGIETNSQSNKINLNSASASELEDIPGVGPVLAARIIEYRETNGSFRSFEDVDGVSGVGPSLLNHLRQHATL